MVNCVLLTRAVAERHLHHSVFSPEEINVIRECLIVSITMSMEDVRKTVLLNGMSILELHKVGDQVSVSYL